MFSDLPAVQPGVQAGRFVFWFQRNCEMAEYEMTAIITPG
jgi:hypothetical protein